MPVADPVIGNWYEDDEGKVFEVVDVDEVEGTIDVQYRDGSLDALELGGWKELELEPVEPPEDWTAALERPNEEGEPGDAGPEAIPGRDEEE